MLQRVALVSMVDASSAPQPRYIVSAPACNRKRPPGSGGECVFRVAWRINPHMRIGAAEPARAILQHDGLVRQLETLGAAVDVLPFVHGAYDSVFAKDSAVLARRGDASHALVAQPLHWERKAEQRARQQSLEARGFRIVNPPATTLEGGDVVVHRRARGTIAYLGHGFRSSRASAAALETFLDAPVTPLALRDAGLYHLDIALAVLDDLTLVCEEALTPQSMRDLAHAAGAGTIVRVPLAEARLFALNFIAIGRDVVLAAGAPTFEATLRGLGYIPRAVPLSEFHLAGGSAGCLAAPVHALERVAVSKTAAMRSTAA